MVKCKIKIRKRDDIDYLIFIYRNQEYIIIPSPDLDVKYIYIYPSPKKVSTVGYSEWRVEKIKEKLNNREWISTKIYVYSFNSKP